MQASCKAVPVQSSHRPEPSETFVRLLTPPIQLVIAVGRQDHKQALCPHRKARCHGCGRIGHLRRTCTGDKKSGGKAAKKGTQSSQVGTVREEGEDPTLVLNQIMGSSAKPITLRVELDSHPLTMEVDTGQLYP